jgi:simple sugar transport system permease protein
LKCSFMKDKELIKMLLITLSIFCAMTVLRPSLFLSGTNFTSMGYQIPELGLYSAAMTIAMLSGGIDLSIVGIGNLCSIICTYILHYAFVQEYQGIWLVLFIISGILISLAAGAVCGLFNGLVIAYGKITPMLATMATSSIFTGLAIIITGGKPVSKVPPEFTYFGSHAFLYVPLPLWLLAAVLLMTAFIINKTKLGFELKFVGTNLKASSYTGINTKLVQIKTYMISGIICAICGMEILSRTDTAKADYASTYVFQALLCAVLGSTNPNGGFAKISCLALALVSLQFLSSGFNMLRLGGYFKEFTWGLLLIFVLSLNCLNTWLRNRKYVKKN